MRRCRAHRWARWAWHGSCIRPVSIHWGMSPHTRRTAPVRYQSRCRHVGSSQSILARLAVGVDICVDVAHELSDLREFLHGESGHQCIRRRH